MLFNQHVTDLLFILRKYGLRHAVICPGSRNAPIIQGFHRNPHFTCHSIVDERSAGYVALGMARELNETVAVVTTSGTAALNLAPAVAEAYHQKIPLLVLTADRPREWPPQLNNQILDQQEIFIRNSKAFYNIPFDINDHDALTKINNKVSEIVIQATAGEPGPIHINVQLKEPLYQELPLDFSGAMSLTNEDMTEPVGLGKIPPGEERLISEYLTGGKKIMILAGMQYYTREEKDLLASLSVLYQVTVIAENITNLSSDLFINCPEIILGSLSETKRKLLRPELVLSFGGQVVSKKIKNFIAKLQDVPVIAVDSFPARFFSMMSKEKMMEEENSFLKLWQSAASVSRKRADNWLSAAPFCNLTSVSRILGKIPEDTVIHSGNSGAIRYLQLFLPGKGLTFYGNRGTSGIDGSLSSAVGAALVSGGLHVVILGDLSFIYDSNGLWNRDFPRNLKIIVLNDSGGGIFRIIEGPDRMSFFEEFSIAHHPVSLQLLTEAFGLSYRIARDYTALEHGLEFIFQKESGPCVLEVDTGKSKNSAIFKQFFHSIKN